MVEDTTSVKVRFKNENDKTEYCIFASLARIHLHAKLTNASSQVSLFYHRTRGSNNTYFHSCCVI